MIAPVKQKTFVSIQAQLNRLSNVASLLNSATTDINTLSSPVIAGNEPFARKLAHIASEFECTTCHLHEVMADADIG